MPTRSEDFAGLTVAMITPFRDGQIDVEALAAPGGVPGRGRHDVRLSGGHHRRVPHALAPGTRAGDFGRGRGGRRTDQGDGRHRQQQHRGGPAADALGRQGRGRRRAGRRPLLQQAHAGRLLSALSRLWPRRSTSPSASTTFPAEPARTSSRKRSSGWPNCPTLPWSRRPPARSTRPRRSSTPPT